MIGGYIYRALDHEIDARIRSSFGPDCHRLEVWNNGFFFYTDPYRSEVKPFFCSAGLIVLSEDLLVGPSCTSRYRHLDLETDVSPDFLSQGTGVFDSIQSDFRMAVAHARGDERILFLTSHRAGSGRIYYRMLEDAIVFCSDLRFLLRIFPLEVNRMGIYSILKYGSVPEPLTICDHIFAIPAACCMRYAIADGSHCTAPYFR